MRIYDSDSDKKINNVTLYLTSEQAEEMKDSLEQLINTKRKHQHEHIPDRDNDFKREITICLYREDDLSGFDERSKILILDDE
jgi:hypothetical protein